MLNGGRGPNSYLDITHKGTAFPKTTETAHFTAENKLISQGFPSCKAC